MPDAPDYLAPALHGEYHRLVDTLTTPARLRDAGTVAKALHEGYQRGRVDALAELLTTEQVAAALGISVRRVQSLARARAVGWRIGRDILFRPEDLGALRDRLPGRPPKITVNGA